MSVSLLASVVRNMTENRVWASQSSEANFVCTLWARAQSRSLKKYDTTDSLYYLSRVSQCLTLHITHIYRLGQAWVPFQTNYMLRFQSWPWYCVLAKYRPQCNEKASSDTWRPCHSKIRRNYITPITEHLGFRSSRHHSTNHSFVLPHVYETWPKAKALLRTFSCR